MSILRAWFEQLPRLAARETLRAIDAAVITMLPRRDAERRLRELQEEAGISPMRKRPVDPATLARMLGVNVVRE